MSTSNYWLDIAVRDIIEAFPDWERPIVLSSGISPSASYHIGHFREIMTADALTWGLKQAGRDARHIHVVDNFDPLRKRYPFLPESYEQYVGWPICLVPDPFDCAGEHKTYAEHFYREFEGFARQMGIIPDEVVRSYEQLYANGRMAERIELAIKHADQIKAIMLEESKRALPEEWLPLQLLSPRKSFTELTFLKLEADRHIIVAQDVAGAHHELDYTAGNAKLPWRVDWPARWGVLGVTVEPFSAQEHGAAGGSYDTGSRISREVFRYEPPMPAVRYANIHMQGDTKKMSSSKGNLITPAQALQILPSEVLRYFVVRSRADRTLYWEAGQGLFNLLKEFAATKEAMEAGQPTEFADAFKFAIASGDSHTISSVPFDHLVQVYQAAQGDHERALEIISRTGFERYVVSQRNEIINEFGYVRNWLRDHAPETVKFSVQPALPDVGLSIEQTAFLDALAESVATASLDGQAMHEAIYAAKETVGLKPAEAFKALYGVILDKDSGPKAGWFLASLDQEWLVARLRRQS